MAHSGSAAESIAGNQFGGERKRPAPRSRARPKPALVGRDLRHRQARQPSAPRRRDEEGPHRHRRPRLPRGAQGTASRSRAAGGATGGCSKTRSTSSMRRWRRPRRRRAALPAGRLVRPRPARPRPSRGKCTKTAVTQIIEQRARSAWSAWRVAGLLQVRAPQPLASAMRVQLHTAKPVSPRSGGSVSPVHRSGESQTTRSRSQQVGIGGDFSSAIETIIMKSSCVTLQTCRGWTRGGNRETSHHGTSLHHSQCGCSICGDATRALCLPEARFHSPSSPSSPVLEPQRGKLVYYLKSA